MTLVLDSQGLAMAVRRDRELTAWLAAARADDERVITSAAVLVEVIHPRIDWRSFEWTVSRLIVEPVTAELARRASRLLHEAGRHGHTDAIDAMLAATALAARGPTTVLTSDPDGIAALCGPGIAVVTV
jgi:predicted nucleic acid-binding protein